MGGFGGQGIILAGAIVGQAAAIFDQKNATFTQEYGPEARGGACQAQVVISDSPIAYPYAESPSVLVAMSPEAYAKLIPSIGPEALLLIDEDLVKPEDPAPRNLLAIPATRFAEELGRKAVANIVMLGFVASVSSIVSTKAMRQAVLASVPKGTEELNTKAFECGHAYGQRLLSARQS